MSASQKSPYDKYKVNIGSFYYADAYEDIEKLKKWCKVNLFLESGTKFQPISNNYQTDIAKIAKAKSLATICRSYQVHSDSTYPGVDENKDLIDKSIQSSFVFQNLFKDASASSEDHTFDEHRFSMVENDMKHHPKFHDIRDCIDRLRHGIVDYAKTVDPDLCCAQFTVLFSTAGGENQDLHEDEVRELEDESECMYSAILALEKGSKLDFAKKVGGTRETLYAVPGTFFLFHGKQIHGGSSYSQSNLRLHFYIFKSEEVRNEYFSSGDRSIVLDCDAPEGCTYKCVLPDTMRQHVKHKHPAIYEEYLKTQSEMRKRVREVLTEEEKKAARKAYLKNYEKNRYQKKKAMKLMNKK